MRIVTDKYCTKDCTKEIRKNGTTGRGDDECLVEIFISVKNHDEILENINSIKSIQKFIISTSSGKEVVIDGFVDFIFDESGKTVKFKTCYGDGIRYVPQSNPLSGMTHERLPDMYYYPSRVN